MTTEIFSNPSETRIKSSSGTLSVRRNEKDGVRVALRAGGGIAFATFPAVELAEALDQIPGFNVTYTPPAPQIPQGIGAIVDRCGNLITRWSKDVALPWIDTSGGKYSDTDIALLLTIGAQIRSEGV